MALENYWAAIILPELIKLETHESSIGRESKDHKLALLLFCTR